MSFTVKEMFFSIQGEGMQTGRAALFCRFSGCNLWSGKEADRSQAKCQFCDTDFSGPSSFGGGIFADEQTLIEAMLETVPSYCTQGSLNYRPMVILTGGEPALQVTQKLIDLLREHGFFIAIETNGTLPLPEGIDWVCVSPKAGSPLHITHGNELKLVWPQVGIKPDYYLSLDFKHFILQPCDDAQTNKNTHICMAYCLTNPAWRLGLQTHKILDID